MTELRQRRPREKNPKHLAAIRLLPCVACCSPPPCEAAHIRMRSPEHGKISTGIGSKPSDRWSLSLCHRCHMDQHSRGEKFWWEMQGIDPIPIAIKLYAVSGDIAAMTRIVRNA
jgi:hypothetical protein